MPKLRLLSHHTFSYTIAAINCIADQTHTTHHTPSDHNETPTDQFHWGRGIVRGRSSSPPAGTYVVD